MHEHKNIAIIIAVTSEKDLFDDNITIILVTLQQHIFFFQEDLLSLTLLEFSYKSKQEQHSNSEKYQSPYCQFSTIISFFGFAWSQGE
jgi:hypothetical protein